MKETSEKIIEPALNQGILLVNGIDWIIGDKLFNSYENKAYWGNAQISFWDIFDAPADGYPESLPDPAGNGEINNVNISNYSTIIWLSEFRNGDINVWNSLAIMDYLNAGGNLILITKRGQDFISEDMREYLGITWDESAYLSTNDFNSVKIGLTDINLSATNTAISLFKTELTQDYSELIYTSEEGFDTPKGAGVWSKPEGKGQFIYLAGRPYNFDPTDLSSNLQKILVDDLGELVDINSEGSSKIPNEFVLEQNYPNPFNPVTTIQYSIPVGVNSESAIVNVKIFDVLGREVETLVNEIQNPGNYEVVFNADNYSSGVYYYQLKAGDFIQTKKMIFLK
jgi:hypothetical protein